MATLGPASVEEGVLRELVRSGVDLFRLNLSHGTQDRAQQDARNGCGAIAARRGATCRWCWTSWVPATGWA